MNVAMSAAPMPPAPPFSHPAASASPASPPAGQSLLRSDPGLPGSGKPVYSSPSPVDSTPQNNECKVAEVRGAKLASFTVGGVELLCLPQAFDLFLKHLVGGLHTVYTKLKRLDIIPVVCNVEQVRILRGLGAIQPGVNRCKLISRRDFELLYSDCTSASSRPGRPPKRSQSVSSPESGSQHMLPKSISSLMTPGLIPHTGLDLPFMMMSHPLIPSVTMAMSQINHLNTVVSMANGMQGQSAPPRTAASVIKERILDSSSPASSLEDGRRPGSHLSSRQSSSVCSSPIQSESYADRTHAHQNGMSLGHPILGLSSNVPGPKEGDLAAYESGHEVKRSSTEKDESLLSNPTCRDVYERLPQSGQTLQLGFPSPLIFPEGLSSMETLLTNIQGLLKVAIDNARVQEKQAQMEKTELKMELFKERELRESLERQLCVEQKSRAMIQKRLKKEKKTKKKLQEALQFESKRRDEAEQSLHQSSTSDANSPRTPHDSSSQEHLSDHSNGRSASEKTAQEGKLFLKSNTMY
ncbi:dachshund c isoform X2 [Denticeps clupeoides]|uniref:dachshund c isoform X2 n=1 Tax=Denticeps clupeoides TaxID=299321 RepID=UPI0010A5975C|nr:dachshund homolog 1-like isoform X2 [Denticeps clupeoides]